MGCGERGGGVDLVLRGRGVRITEQIRRVAEHKLAKIGRIDPRVTRLDVEITGDLNPRTGGSHRVEVTCSRGRRLLRAEGLGSDVDTALDQVAQRLERQISSYRGRLRDRFTRRRHRLQSFGTSTEESDTSV
jgi:ribosomal subunit interface protein